MPAFAAGLSACGSATSAPLALLEAEAVGDLVRHRLDLHADPAARDLPLSLSWVTTVLTVSAGIAKAMPTRAARRREDRGVDADHVAFDVEGRAAGIALVDRRVDLDEVVIGAGADVAAARRDDAGRDGAAEAERIADRQHPVADARRLRRRASRYGKSLRPSTLISARSVRGSVPITLAV